MYEEIRVRINVKNPYDDLKNEHHQTVKSEVSLGNTAHAVAVGSDERNAS